MKFIPRHKQDCFCCCFLLLNLVAGFLLPIWSTRTLPFIRLMTRAPRIVTEESATITTTAWASVKAPWTSSEVTWILHSSDFTAANRAAGRSTSSQLSTKLARLWSSTSATRPTSFPLIVDLSRKWVMMILVCQDCVVSGEKTRASILLENGVITKSKDDTDYTTVQLLSSRRITGMLRIALGGVMTAVKQKSLTTVRWIFGKSTCAKKDL